MKYLKKKVIFFVIVTLVIFSFFIFKNKTVAPTINDISTVQTDSTFEPFTASFEIYTLGTKRTFTNSMYHNLSSDIYIESSDPSIIYVKKQNITWRDFFDTLPFSIDEECLVTGTKQTFCTNSQNTLNFYLNDNNHPEALDEIIKPNDLLIIKYE